MGYPAKGDSNVNELDRGWDRTIFSHSTGTGSRTEDKMLTNRRAKPFCHLTNLILSLICLSLAPGCGSDKPAAPQPPTLAQRVAGSEQRLAFKFFPLISEQYPDSNVIYSPLDMMFESSGILLGAKWQGAEEIKQGMEVESLTVEQTIQGLMTLRQSLSASSSSFGFQQVLFDCQGQGLLETYLAKCSTLLATEIVRFDCSSPRADSTIMEWWDEQNHGYYSATYHDVIDSSWIYFPISFMWYDGKWATPFPATTVRQDSFLTSTGERVACSLMTASGQFQTYNEPGFSAVVLPFADPDFASAFLLPDTSSTIAEMIESLSLAKWKYLLSHLVTQEVIVDLPKFTHQAKGLNVKSSMQAIGIERLFYNIDLSNMVDLPSAASSDWMIVQYHRFLPDSIGNMSAKLSVSVEQNAASVRCDRPFFYLVWHRPTGTVLYLGKVVRPALN